MIAAIEKYPVPDPINLGTDEEVTIKELVKKIVDLSGKKSQVVFDTSKPDGSPRRNSDNRKAKEKLNFIPKYNLDNGLRKTVEWYKNEFNLNK